MRTTIGIEDHLLAEAGARAAASGRMLAAVVEDALRELFTRRAATRLPADPSCRCSVAAGLPGHRPR